MCSKGIIYKDEQGIACLQSARVMGSHALGSTIGRPIGRAVLPFWEGGSGAAKCGNFAAGPRRLLVQVVTAACAGARQCRPPYCRIGKVADTVAVCGV